MLKSKRATINHIKNYVRQLDKRLVKYQAEINKKERPACSVALFEITKNCVDDLKALLKWYEEKQNG